MKQGGGVNRGNGNNNPAGGGGGGKKKESCLAEIQRLERERQERRKAAEEKRLNRLADEKRFRDNGNPGDVDFQKMIVEFREKLPNEEPHAPPGEMKICICVRKRPINSKELKKKDHDSLTIRNPLVVVHDCKLKVDGITKYLDNSSFKLDHTFNEDDTTDDIYLFSVQPFPEYVLRGGRATVFAYGQTGSGKTFTMVGIQKLIAEDLFYLVDSDDSYSNLKIGVSFFEIYGGRCQDLLNHRHRLEIREDGNGEVNIAGLEEVSVASADDLLAVIDIGNRNRTTHATESNDESSRSHAICQMIVRKESGKVVGKLSLIDLAGSERGADTKSHNRQRRMEGAEINKSLLALKECIRALDSSSSHVPYRASKLTLVLKDSFTNKNSRTVMIVNVSPGASSADHTLNTLRYADRVKERVVGDFKGPAPPTPQVASQQAPARNQQAKANAPQRRPSDPEPPSDRRKWDRGESKAGGRQILEEDEYDDDRNDDLHQLHMSIRMDRKRDNKAYDHDSKYDEKLEEEDLEHELEDVEVFHRTVEGIFDEEENLLNLHMSIIQENAELLTEEGRLLQQIQGSDDYDIDAYAQRLDEILQRKQVLINELQGKLTSFRNLLKREEVASKRVHVIPVY